MPSQNIRSIPLYSDKPSSQKKNQKRLQVPSHRSYENKYILNVCYEKHIYHI